MTRATISRWQPRALLLDDVGPFRQGLDTFRFVDESHGGDSSGPANMYMLPGAQRQGKTTALDAMFGLFGLSGLLCDPPTGRFAEQADGGRAQFDVRANWIVDGVGETVPLSLWTGDVAPLRS